MMTFDDVPYKYVVFGEVSAISEVVVDHAKSVVEPTSNCVMLNQ